MAIPGAGSAGLGADTGGIGCGTAGDGCPLGIGPPDGVRGGVTGAGVAGVPGAGEGLPAELVTATG